MRYLFLLPLFLSFSVHAQPDARALYDQHCAQCHGKNLEGGNAHSMIDKVWMFGADDGYIKRSIKHGVTHLGMPAYESTLSDEEIGALVKFIRAKEQESPAVKPPVPDQIQTLDYEVKIEKWVTGLDTPMSIAFADADTALLVEKPGNLRVIQQGALQPPVTGTPEVLHEGHAGMLAVAVDPKFSENGWVYLAFGHAIAKPEGAERAPAMTKVVRGHLKDNTWTDEQVVFQAKPEHYLETRVHFGTQIVFDKAGHLYFSIGERGIPEHAQDITRPNGKVHRLWPDGSIPEDNPFVNTEGACPSIFSYGNRNAQGLSVHPETDLLWESEHGPMGGDELNVIRAGLNYGWPKVTWGRDYSGKLVSEFTRGEGYAQPALYWRPSIAVCGVGFYTGSMFPRWNNALLVTALKDEQLSVVQVEQDHALHEEVILRNVGRIRDAEPGPDEAVYVVTNSPDQVLRLTLIKERSY